MSRTLYPVTIVKDRYGGTYSGGPWTAFHAYAVPAGPQDDDLSAGEFWSTPGMPIGVGNSPNEALGNLVEDVLAWRQKT